MTIPTLWIIVVATLMSGMPSDPQDHVHDVVNEDLPITIQTHLFYGSRQECEQKALKDIPTLTINTDGAEAEGISVGPVDQYKSTAVCREATLPGTSH